MKSCSNKHFIPFVIFLYRFFCFRVKEQNYQRYREERFRATSESTNQRVLWWSVAQLFILITAGFWQMRHLKVYILTA